MVKKMVSSTQRKIKKTASGNLPSIRKKLSIQIEIIKSAPTASIIALHKAGGWWEESAENRAVVPVIVRKSFAFAVAKTARGKIVGMGRVISDGCSDGYIQDVAVLDDWRGQGIGQSIIKSLTDHCTRKGLSWIGLVAKPGTSGFYRKIGFKSQKGFNLMLFTGEVKK